MTRETLTATDRHRWEEGRELVETFGDEILAREAAAHGFRFLEALVVEALRTDDLETAVDLAEGRIIAIEVAEDNGVDWRAISAELREAA